MKKAFGFLFSLIYVLVGFSGCDLFGEGGSSILKVYYARAVYTYNFNITEDEVNSLQEGKYFDPKNKSSVSWLPKGVQKIEYASPRTVYFIAQKGYYFESMNTPTPVAMPDELWTKDISFPGIWNVIARYYTKTVYVTDYTVEIPAAKEGYKISPINIDDFKTGITTTGALLLGLSVQNKGTVTEPVYEIRYSKCGQGYEIEDGKVKFTLLGTIQKPSGRLTVKYVVNE